MKRSLWLVAGALAVSCLASGLANAQETPVRGGVLNYGVAGGPHTIDCHGGNSFAVLHHVGPH